MSLFACEKCGCAENTAVCNYWTRNLDNPGPKKPALCSECDPVIGKWHGIFVKQGAQEAGLAVGPDGFLYSEAELPAVVARMSRGAR